MKMIRIIRAAVLGLLTIAALGTSGCGWSRGWIHTWTGTYAEYPPSLYDPHPAPPQGNPSDG